ncbi:MAG TPA: hypothetical protein VLA37_03125 [Sphingomonadaceae bacterium]|nr:hypothetical protein [Sphingomonadaceae bacterium]
MTFAILWEYDVPQTNRQAFETAYGPAGPWVELFSRSNGYLGTSLFRDGARYLTVDRWHAQTDFERFRREFAEAYDSLDRKLEGLASNETRLGVFEEIES